MPPKNNDVVSSLMRAAAGSSAKDVDDENLDEYIADMLAKEAQEKRKKYDEIGVQAFQLDNRLKKKPKPNTRFLLNVVKATDSHNQAVIKANDENVARMRRERLAKEKLEREKAKINRSTSTRRQYSSSRSPSPERRRYSSKRSPSLDQKRRSSSRSPSPTSKERSPSRSLSPSNNKRRSSSRSPSPSNKRHSQKRSPSPEKKHSSSSADKKRHRSPEKKHHSKKRSKKSSSHKKRHRHRSPSPQEVQFKGRGKVRINVSSMDKYFSEDYDPLFDVHSDEESREKSKLIGPTL